MGTKELQRFIDHKSLVALKKYAEIEAQYKAAKEHAEAITEQIKQAMIDNGVTKIDGDWGYITLAERTSYSTKDISSVPKQFIKPTLDGAKIKAAVVLANKLPKGVIETKTQYITKKLKDL